MTHNTPPQKAITQAYHKTVPVTIAIREKKLKDLWFHAVRSQPGSISATIALLHSEQKLWKLWKMMWPQMERRARQKLRYLRRKMKRLDAAIEREKASTEKHRVDALAKLLRQRKIYEQEQKRIQLRRSRAHGIMKESTGSIDLIGDIRWVYENMGELFQTTPEGVRVLNRLKLQQAPTPGAITMAEYAADDMKAFLEKFVIKLLPKAETRAPRESRNVKENTERLDPGLSELDQYFAKGEIQDGDPDTEDEDDAEL
jgi:hypothetical protein